MIHRMVCFELPSRLIGRFRTEAVSITLPGRPSRPSHAPDEIPRSIQALCADWAAEIAGAADEAARLDAIARFHHRFLAIHPFLDGNGRTARALLLQQCLDTFGRADMSRLDRGVVYQAAITAADTEDLSRSRASSPPWSRPEPDDGVRRGAQASPAPPAPRFSGM
jgi:fido (protein-threonine AMPylation protein)